MPSLFRSSFLSAVLISAALPLAACDVTGRSGPPGDPPDMTRVIPVPDLAPIVTIDGGGTDSGSGQAGCGEFTGCYTVYAHTDRTLYRIDLQKQLLEEVGPFKAPQVAGREDSITDLAVAPDDTIYVISKTNLYTADRNDGHVTLVSPITACGDYAVALTFMADGSLYAGDHLGAFCRIDLSVRPPKLVPLGAIGGGWALAGDLVAVLDGTMYGTVYKPNDTATTNNNVLVRIDPTTGDIKQTIGSTGYPRLFGTAFDLGKVFGFTSNGTGTVVTIDPKTGKATLFGTFTDSSGKGINFAGAGVNARVDPIIG